LGERLNGIQEVDGSIPFSSTKSPHHPGSLASVRLDHREIEPSTSAGIAASYRLVFVAASASNASWAFASAGLPQAL
jgi:hypothetical protein